eukprot:m.131373 g.131373  ORF g.131373 m.131373 type:complete len:68 (+) comp15909_c0_seq9:2232-2435(+)
MSSFMSDVYQPSWDVKPLCNAIYAASTISGLPSISKSIDKPVEDDAFTIHNGLLRTGMVSNRIKAVL